jgi:hypothetical protein
MVISFRLSIHEQSNGEPSLRSRPVIFLSIDTPRRDPKDIVFVNPGDGTPESFIRADR